MVPRRSQQRVRPCLDASPSALAFPSAKVSICSCFASTSPRKERCQWKEWTSPLQAPQTSVCCPSTGQAVSAATAAPATPYTQPHIPCTHDSHAPASQSALSPHNSTCLLCPTLWGSWGRCHPHFQVRRWRHRRVKSKYR